MTDPVETSGRSVEEAIDKALAILGATDDEVEIQILSEGGDMVRRDEARVRVKLRDERSHDDVAFEAEVVEEDFEPDASLVEQAEAARGFLEGLTATMGLEAEIATKAQRDDVLIELTGSELALLIGRHGSTLEALQEVTRAAVQREVGERAFVNVDVEGYRARRRAILERRARSAAARVRRSGKPQALEPMPAYERKVVHDVLTRFQGVRTISDGEEPNRRVVISPA